MPFTVIRKQLSESLISEVLGLRVSSGMLQYTYDNTSWLDLGALGTEIVSVTAETLAPGTPATASLIDGILTLGIPAGAAGTNGLDGAPGTDGEDGTPGADGANGADGLQIELGTDDGYVVWRYEGVAEWTRLIALEEICDCDDDETGVLEPSARNRCGVAVALTSSLKRAYTRMKLDPDGWDELQHWSGLAAASGAVTSSAGGILAAITGATALTGGLALYGLIIGGVGTIAATILGITNDNADNFTLSVEDELAQGLYCVLTRRETATISADVLREWISFIADSSMPDADIQIVCAALGFVPVQYWKNEAAVAAPKVNPCYGETCASRDTEFVYQFSASPTMLHTPFYHPVAGGMIQITMGTRDQYGIQSQETALNTRRLNVTIHLGRIVALTGIEAEFIYDQTRAASSPCIVTGTGFSQTQTIEGIDDGSVLVHWGGLVFVDKFHISAEVATAGDFDEDALLDLFRLKICGVGFPTFGAAYIQGSPCEPPADPYGCDDPAVPAGMTWCATADLKKSTLHPQLLMSNGGTFTPGVGIEDVLQAPANGRQRRVSAVWDFGSGTTGFQLRYVKIEYYYSRGVSTHSGTRGLLLTRDKTTATTNFLRSRNLNTMPNTAGDKIELWTGTQNALGGIGLDIWCGGDFSAPYTDPGGTVTITRITVAGVGTPPPNIISD